MKVGFRTKNKLCKKSFPDDWDVNAVDEECSNIPKLQLVVCTFFLLRYSDGGKSKK